MKRVLACVLALALQSSAIYESRAADIDSQAGRVASQPLIPSTCDAAKPTAASSATIIMHLDRPQDSKSDPKNPPASTRHAFSFHKRTERSSRRKHPEEPVDASRVEAGALNHTRQADLAEAQFSQNNSVEVADKRQAIKPDSAICIHRSDRNTALAYEKNSSNEPVIEQESSSSTSGRAVASGTESKELLAAGQQISTASSPQINRIISPNPIGKTPRKHWWGGARPQLAQVAKGQPSIPNIPDSPPVKLLPPVADDSKVFRQYVAITRTQHILGPGDVLEITDRSLIDIEASAPTAPYQAPILTDGTTTIPPIGIITAAGMTLSELTKYVNDAAKKYIRNPDIYVGLLKERPTTVTVLGEVANPGVYPQATATATAAVGAGVNSFALAPESSGIMTISKALQLAGGVKKDADVRHISITKAGTHQVYTVDLVDLLVHGDVSQNIVLDADDAIFVPHSNIPYNMLQLGALANRERQVNVYGAVKTPGVYEMKSSDDIVTAISKAGGPAQFASDKVRLNRVNTDGSITSYKFSLNASLNDPTSPGRLKLQAGDTVVMRVSQAKKSAHAISVALLTFVTATALVYVNNQFSYGLFKKELNFTNRNNVFNQLLNPTTSGTVVNPSTTPIPLL